MERRVKDGLRAGATAVGVATAFMTLATTSQTPDGYIHASFGGPLDVFTKNSTDTLAIGDGANDPSELTDLLKGPSNPTTQVPDSPYRAAYEAGATPSPTTAPSVIPFTDPTAAPAVKDSAILPVKPVVDAQGKIDCTGAVSCKTDPATKTTTVTYPDGVVAVVQQINDLTIVAYKTLTDGLPAQVKALLPPAPEMPAAPALASTPTAQRSAATPAATDAPTATFDPGPPAPSSITPGPADVSSAPKVNVTRGPIDFSSTEPTKSNLPKPNLPGLDKFKDALGSVVNAVTDAVGKVVGPGAAGKSDAPNSGRPARGSSGSP